MQGTDITRHPGSAIIYSFFSSICSRSESTWTNQTVTCMCAAIKQLVPFNSLQSLSITTHVTQTGQACIPCSVLRISVQFIQPPSVLSSGPAPKDHQAMSRETRLRTRLGLSPRFHILTPVTAMSPRSLETLIIKHVVDVSSFTHRNSSFCILHRLPLLCVCCG